MFFYIFNKIIEFQQVILINGTRQIYYLSKEKIYHSIPRLTMSKLLKIAIVFLSICLISIFVAFHSLHQKYSSFPHPQNPKYQNLTLQQNYKYQHLKTLSNIPLVGSHFKQSLIQQIIKRKQWPEAIQQSELALKSIVNSRSYKIWYFKAIAECAEFQFQSCQKSLYEAQFLAPKQFMKKVYKLKEIFNFQYKSNLKVRKEQLQSL